MKVYDIKWDTDGDEKLLKSLPQEVEVNLIDIGINISPADPNYKSIVNDTISDWLSDTYGYCHYGFCIEGIDD